MISRGRIATLSAVLLLTAVATAPAAARADSVTIGSSLQEPYEFACCGAGLLGVQRSLGGTPPHPLESPVNGRITSWQVRSGDLGAVYSLRVLGLVGSFTYVANGTAPAPTAIPSNTDTIYTYPASLLIGEGETIGLQVAAPRFLPANLISSASDVMAGGPPIADGSTGALSDTYPVELLFQATVDYCEVPKVKGKRTKKAKRALRKAGCGVKVKKKSGPDNKVGKVLRQKQKKGTTVPPGKKIVIFVGK